MPSMEDTSDSDIPGQQLAGGYSGHGEPFHPQSTYTSLNAGQGDLLAEPCNTYIPGVHQWGEAAEGSSTADIFSYATGDDLDPDAEPISLAGKAQVCTPNYLNFKRHAFRQEFDQCNWTTDGNRQITIDTDGDGFDHRRFSNADVIIFNTDVGGFDNNGEKLPMASYQALGGHRRFSNADVIILNTDGDGVDSNGEKLAMASFQALGGNRRCSNAYVIILDMDGDGFVSNGDSLSMVSSEALGGQRDCNYANAESTVNTEGNAFGPNGEPLSMASFQVLGVGAHHGCSYADAEPRSPSTDGELFTRSVAGELNYYYPYASSIQSVWSDNCARVFKRVVDKLRQPRRHLYIALDLEFVADASTNVRFRPICWSTWYDHLRTLVNGGEMLQVGLALALDDLDLDLDHQYGGAQAPSSVIALEINLKFDVNAREYSDESITFLTKQGHCLAEYRDRGVTTEQLLNGLLNHIPFGDDSVTWVTFHGDNDFGFLVRLLQKQQGLGVLPPDRADFMRQVRQLFPVFYDVRVLGQLEKEGFTGSLTALAAHLGVRRIGGEHHAGSDALLTLSCFKEIRRRNEHEPHRLHSRRFLLSGMEEFDMAIRCARHIDDATVITVVVRGHNFDDEARRIDELVTSNFMTVGVDVQLPPLGWGIPFYAADPQQDYDLMKSSLKGIDTFQVTIGFMNAEGMLAYGRVWKFHLSSRVDPAVAGGNNAYVHPGQLARLLKSCGATHNPNVAWVTNRGSHGIACLIKSFLAADDLPIYWCSYIKHQRRVLPNLYDVGLIAHGYGLRMLLAPQALLVLRCYKRQAESPWFPHIAEGVRGKLMASQSCFWYGPIAR